ncbi:MAG: hypothetical protein K8S54_03285 [Spirochaetia bacterium]|nr:hypothetical protein [Spirochaetia bacterium]
MKRVVLLCLLIALSLLAEPLGARQSILLADAVVPGFGAFYTGHYALGTAIATSRIGTGYLSWYYSQRAREYGSAEKAARIAELYFGPGYRFKNPYGSGYYNASEYSHLAGKRKFYANIALLVHLGVAVTSGFLTADWLDEARPTPVFPMPARMHEQPVSFTVRLTF